MASCAFEAPAAHDQQPLAVGLLDGGAVRLRLASRRDEAAGVFGSRATIATMSSPSPVIALCSLALAGCASMSPDEREVLAVCQAFFDVIESRDAERGAQLTMPEGAFFSVHAVDGEPVVQRLGVAQWLQGLADGRQHYREYFTGAPTVLVADGDVAVVWADYVFEVDGERSHTGVDAFHLVRTADGWKIAGCVYTVVR